MEHMRVNDKAAWKKIVDMNKRSPDDTFTGEDPEHPPNSRHRRPSNEPNGTPSNPSGNGDASGSDRNGGGRTPKEDTAQSSN
eukprot:1091586-Karenia_brevis.AAC.1